MNEIGVRGRNPRKKAVNIVQRLAFVSLCLFVFTIPWENFVIIPGVGTLSRVVGIFMAIFGGLSLLVSGKIRRNRVVIALPFLAWVLTSSLWSLQPGRAIQYSFTLIQLVIFTWLLIQLVRGRSDVVALLHAYVYGAFVSALDTVRIFSLHMGGGGYRFVATGFNENYLAYTLVLGIPITVYLLSSAASRGWHRLLLLMYPVVAVLAIVLTGSRGALITLLIALLYGALSVARKSLRNLIAGAIVLGIIFSITMSIVPERTLERLATTFSELTSGTLGQRTELWAVGLKELGRVPLHGVGAGGYVNVVERALTSRQTAHNAFINIVTETGIIGMLLFLPIPISAVISGVFTKRAGDREFILVSLLILATILMVATWETQKTTWFFLGLALSSRSFFGSDTSRVHDK